MRYEIFGGTLPAVSVFLETGESIYTQSGGMTWMTEGFSMETNMKGGLMKGLGRMLSGDSLFMVTYTAQRPAQEITLASTFPGTLLALQVGPMGYVCQKSAFLCATPGVGLSVMVNRAKAGFFGGEGFIMQQVTGDGIVFLELDGTVVERTLRSGERIKVDTGNVAAFEQTVRMTAETVKGFKNIMFGGEGLFLTVLEGPGKVWLQTVNIGNFAGRLAPYLPKRGD
ncbi:MAG: TIGR00266 family protein [Christensenellales bacterium]|jgi:uncharacterized protein (TIGR00266 family)